MPKSKVVLSSTSGSDSDSELETKVRPEAPLRTRPPGPDHQDQTTRARPVQVHTEDKHAPT